MDKEKRNKILAIIGLFALFIIIQGLFRNVFDELELLSYDFRAKLSIDGNAFSDKFLPADDRIVIIAIDDFSRNVISKYPNLNLGAWPWRRNIWGEVADYIEGGNPKVLLYDLIFTDINYDNSYDEQLSKTFTKYNNIILATTVNSPILMVKNIKQDMLKDSQYLPTATKLQVNVDNKDIDRKWTYFTHSAVHDIYTNYNIMGVVNKISSQDNIIRNSQPLFKLIKENRTYYLPSLAFAGFIKAIGPINGKIEVKNNTLTYQNHVIPLNKDGQIPINWHGLGKNYPTISVSDIILKKVNPDYFKNKIVIIGRTEAGTDIHTTSVSPRFTGPEVNATVIDNLLNDTNPTVKNRKIIKQVPFSIDILITFVFCILIVIAGIFSVNSLIGLFNSILIIMIFVLLNILAFEHPYIRLWFDMIIPLYYMIATTAISFTVRLQKEHARKSLIMNAFGKFVSPSVLKTVLQQDKELILENTKKHITIMFCDVKNFTTLSENTNPKILVSDLNEMFEIIVNIVFKNKGTVDKFVGDCIMAYWGDPIANDDDALMSIKTAFEIKEALKNWREKNPNKLQLDVKIGISTGDALLGLVGSKRLMSYTAMGDVVNTASRLETSCRKYGRDILISKSTHDEIEKYIDSEKVGTVEVKGKSVLIEIYEPKGLKQDV